MLATKADPAPTGPTPIFIVGMPRAGSTLIEQILASHPDVEGTHELPELARVGRLLEVTPDGEVVWEYVNPVTEDGIVRG